MFNDRPIESEASKIVENSYRATTLAFLNEWSLFAERNGVDLINRFGDRFHSALSPQHLVLLSTIFFGFEDDIFKITLLTPDLAEGKPGRLPIFSQGK